MTGGHMRSLSHVDQAREPDNLKNQLKMKKRNCRVFNTPSSLGYEQFGHM